MKTAALALAAAAAFLAAALGGWPAPRRAAEAIAIPAPAVATVRQSGPSAPDGSTHRITRPVGRTGLDTYRSPPGGTGPVTLNPAGARLAAGDRSPAGNPATPTRADARRPPRNTGAVPPRRTPTRDAGPPAGGPAGAPAGRADREAGDPRPDADADPRGHRAQGRTAGPPRSGQRESAARGRDESRPGRSGRGPDRSVEPRRSTRPADTTADTGDAGGDRRSDGRRRGRSDDGRATGR